MTQGVHRVERPSLSSLASPADTELSFFACFVRWFVAGSMTHRVDRNRRAGLSRVLLIVNPKGKTVVFYCFENVRNFSSVHSLAVASLCFDAVVFQDVR